VSSLALIALLAEAAAQPVYGPAAPAKPQPKVAAAALAADRCAEQRPRNDREIVVCAPRPDGYRLNPDVLEAKREAKSGGNRTNPPPSYRDTTACASVGPFGCTGTPTINLLAVGMVLATMARRAATGGNVGEMFVTPQKSEYDLYVEARARREAKEKAAAAAQLAEVARAQAAAKLAAAPPSATTAAP
jgi:hypothetical protein